MGKMQQLRLASSLQQGILSIGPGLRGATPGVVDALRPIADLWVHASGDDTDGDGSMGNPFQTLVRAFAFIVANPLVGGYTVYLPSGHWQETVGLPPPETRIVGQGIDRTWLEDVGGGTLTWTEGATDPGTRIFEDLNLVADASGFDGGDLYLILRRAAAPGVFTLVGRLDMDACDDGSFSNFVNCSNVRVFNPRSKPTTSFAMSYDPLAGTNGPGAVYNQVSGGLWAGIAYTSNDDTVPLYVLNANVRLGLTAIDDANIKAIGTKATALISTNPGSRVEYDGPINDTVPTFSGLGEFGDSELVLKRTIPADFGTGDVTIPVPPQLSATLKNTYAMADMAGVGINWVSSTVNSITLRVTAAAPHPSYEIRVLVKP